MRGSSSTTATTPGAKGGITVVSNPESDVQRAYSGTTLRHSADDRRADGITAASRRASLSDRDGEVAGHPDQIGERPSFHLLHHASSVDFQGDFADRELRRRL